MNKKKSDDTIKKVQSERLLNVLYDLNLSQADIVKILQYNKISTDSSRMSDFVNGKRPIQDDVLNALHMLYFINPNYIKGKSDDMYDIPKTILNYAFSFAKKITVVENPDRKIKLHNNSVPTSPERYLHITMDEKYYNYLIHLDTLEEASEKGNFDREKIISGIKELYKNGEHKPKEYILLPRNAFVEILETYQRRTKRIQEYLDLEKCLGYKDCKEVYQVK